MLTKFARRFRSHYLARYAKKSISLPEEKDFGLQLLRIVINVFLIRLIIINRLLLLLVLIDRDETHSQTNLKHRNTVTFHNFRSQTDIQFQY